MKSIVSLLVLAALVAGAAPIASAGDSRTCTPQDAVCLVQNDGLPGDPKCQGGYLSRYGPHMAENAVYVRSAPANGVVRLYEACGHWFIADSYAYGAAADVRTTGGALQASWTEGWTRANPGCNWGQDHFRDRTTVNAVATASGSRAGVTWQDYTQTSCRTGATAYSCSTWIYTAGVAPDTNIGCPVGSPPSPPSPSAVSYGALLP